MQVTILNRQQLENSDLKSLTLLLSRTDLRALIHTNIPLKPQAFCINLVVRLSMTRVYKRVLQAGLCSETVPPLLRPVTHVCKLIIVAAA